MVAREKARMIIEKISKISETEGKKARSLYENFPNKNIEKSTFISIGGSVMHSLAIELKKTQLCRYGQR